MARKNMYVKEEAAGGGGGGGGKRPRTGAVAVPAGMYIHTSGPGHNPPPSYAHPAPHMAAPASRPYPTAASGGGGGGGGSGSGGGSGGGNPPCNTLFVGNLGDAVSEDELRGVFGACQVSAEAGGCWDLGSSLHGSTWI